MQQVLGRALDPDEIVVHRDGDLLNDDLSNLEVVSRAEYMRIHLPRIPVQKWSARDVVAAVWLYTAGMTISEVALHIERHTAPRGEDSES